MPTLTVEIRGRRNNAPTTVTAQIVIANVAEEITGGETIKRPGNRPTIAIVGPASIASIICLKDPSWVGFPGGYIFPGSQDISFGGGTTQWQIPNELNRMLTGFPA